MKKIMGSGGAREGAGRRNKYGEPTKQIIIRVPFTKKKIILLEIKDLLKKYEQK